MSDIRQTIREQGRDARNLLVYHLGTQHNNNNINNNNNDNSNHGQRQIQSQSNNGNLSLSVNTNTEAVSSRLYKKPPKAPLSPSGMSDSSVNTNSSASIMKSKSGGSRVRSASTGRDKRSELQARYWGLLFGNLQRAIGELYSTVEAHESSSECKEVILVLENYTRDFKSLCEWFRLKWEYDNTPPPQRPNSFAWEVRKTSPPKPEPKRVRSDKSSPSVSGKSSPSISGKSSPCPTVGKISPSVSNSKISPSSSLSKVNPSTCLSPKIKPENKFFNSKVEVIVEGEVSDRDVQFDSVECDIDSIKTGDVILNGHTDEVRNEIHKENPSDFPLLPVPQKITGAKNNKNKKNEINKVSKKISEVAKSSNSTKKLPNHIKHTTDLLDEMENKYLENLNSQKQPNCIKIKNDSDIENLNQNQNESLKCDVEKKLCLNIPESQKLEEVLQEVKKIENVVETKRGYSQAASRPKSVINKTVEVKPVNKSTEVVRPTTLNLNKSENNENRFTRSKTIAEIKQGPCKRAELKNLYKNNTKQPVNRNTGSYPFNLTEGRGRMFDTLPNRTNFSSKQEAKKIECSKVTLPCKKSNLSQNIKNSTDPNIGKTLSTFDSVDLICSSSETLVGNKLESSYVESNESIKTLCPDQEQPFSGSVEVLELNNSNDGWLTVKCRRLGKNNQLKKANTFWSNRYDQPSATASLPTLNMIESPKAETKDIVKLEISMENTPVVKEAIKKPENQKLKKEHKNFNKKTVSTKSTRKNEKINTQMIKQKSDLTGFKSKTKKNSFGDSQKSDKNNVKTNNISDFLLKSKKLKNKVTKMHFSSDDLHSLKCDHESTEKIDEFGSSKNSINFKKSHMSIHMSFESLNSDTCISNTLRGGVSSSVEISTLNKDTPNAYDGDNDEETSKECLHDAIDSDTNEIEMMTNQIEENERRIDLALDWQSEEDQRKLAEEEELLNKQIQELQQGSDLEMDTETDDTETDGEILCEEDDDVNEELKTISDAISHSKQMKRDYTNLDTIEIKYYDSDMSLEDRYEPILANMSGVERMNVLAALHRLVSRDPGRAQQLHAKLSNSMRRRGSLQETLRRYQAKQARAEQHRRALQKERSDKLHQLLTRVEDVKSARAQLIEEKRIRMEQRLQKAAENRDQRIKDIVRKAHDEDEKLREIAFIKQLEAEHKRQDFLEQCREQTSRLIEVRADRLRRLEEKAAKEAAVEERRKALETERIMKLDKMRESKRQREERVGRQQMLKEKERVQLAEEKARERSERMSALLAAQRASAVALKKKIFSKQNETARRHQQTISLIKQRALELSSQRSDIPTDLDNHKIKNSEIISRPKLQADNYKKNSMNSNTTPAYNMEDTVEDENTTVLKDKNKSQKKRIRKIKQRIISKGQEYEATYQYPIVDTFSTKSKISRSINQIISIVHRQNQNNITQTKTTSSLKDISLESRKCSSVHSSLSDVSSKNSSSPKNDSFLLSCSGNINQLDRFLGELTRIMEKQLNITEKLAWQKLDGFSVLNDILSGGFSQKDNFTDVSLKTLISTSHLYRMSCELCPSNCDYILLSSKILIPIDLLLQRLQVSISSGTPCPLASSLQKLVIVILRTSTPAVASRIQDLVNYCLCCGLVDLVSQWCGSVQDPLSPASCDLIDSSLRLLATLVDLAAQHAQGESLSRMCGALRSTELGGGLRAGCYALAAPPPGDQLPAPALTVAHAALALMDSVARAHLNHYQEALSEGGGLQFRHLAARLLRHASGATSKDQSSVDRLLHALLPPIGYFALNSSSNQDLLTSGSSPCVLQQLGSLPFRYFSGIEHTRVLLPVLIVCCSRNQTATKLLHKEVSSQLLEDFHASEDGKKSQLLSLLKTEEDPKITPSENP